MGSRRGLWVIAAVIAALTAVGCQQDSFRSLDRQVRNLERNIEASEMTPVVIPTRAATATPTPTRTPSSLSTLSESVTVTATAQTDDRNAAQPSPTPSATPRPTLRANSTATPRPSATPTPTPVRSGASTPATSTPTVRPTPTFAPARLPTFTLENASGQIGQRAQVRLILQGVPEGISGFIVDVEVEDPSVARIAGMEMPDYGLKSSGPVPAGSVNIKAADINRVIKGTPSGDMAAVLTVELLKAGETRLTLALSRLDDSQGNSLVPNTVVRPGRLTVTAPR